MKSYKHIEEYSVREINGILDALRQRFDMVQLVDVEECRVLEVQPDGSIHYGRECFRIWDRSMRCADCSGYRACMTHQARDKTEHVHGGRQLAHSIPVYLELLSGELALCAIDCVKLCGPDAAEQPADDHETLSYIHAHDVLTRLYTQEKLFHEIRQRMISRPEADYLVVAVNIRNFRLVNKLFGIEGGNRVLVGVADLLREACGEDEIYGRCHDDRFLLLTQAGRFDEARMLHYLERARELVASPIFSIQLQLGVYAVEDLEMPITTMLEHAELALGALRGTRRQSIAYYTPSMMAQKLKDQHVIVDFEQALRNGDFQMYLQPQVRHDGWIHGGEALVRWVRPGGEVVPPADFLDVLRQSDLLATLDAYIWEQAARQLSAWQGTAFEDLYISVNVDPADFFYHDVPHMLSELCRRYAIPPRLLRVEITETALVHDFIHQGGVVDTLHAAGFIVEIDDFGKGSSSLSMLKDVQADVLKIDMGFVHGANNLVRKRVILESVIEMAHNLQMGVVTEGVETREQVDRLIRMGCDDFQGFYFSRPIPVGDFEAVVSARRG